jgi:hypothetical protein
MVPSGLIKVGYSKSSADTAKSKLKKRTSRIGIMYFLGKLVFAYSKRTKVFFKLFNFWEGLPQRHKDTEGFGFALFLII